MRESRAQSSRDETRWQPEAQHEREKRELRRFVVQGTIARCSVIYHSLYGRAPASSLSCSGSPPLDNKSFVVNKLGNNKKTLTKKFYPIKY